VHKNLYLICGVIFIGVITFFSLKESISFPIKIFSFTDKVFHMGSYLVLTFFWGKYLILLKPKLSIKKLLIILSASLVLYGIIIEILQTVLTKNRVGEVQDVIANIVGIIFGVIVLRHLINLKLNSNKGLFF